MSYSAESKHGSSLLNEKERYDSVRADAEIRGGPPLRGTVHSQQVWEGVAAKADTYSEEGFYSALSESAHDTIQRPCVFVSAVAHIPSLDHVRCCGGMISGMNRQ